MLLHNCACGDLLSPLAVAPAPFSLVLDMFILPLLFFSDTSKMFCPWHFDDPFVFRLLVVCDLCLFRPLSCLPPFACRVRRSGGILDRMVHTTRDAGRAAHRSRRKDRIPQRTADRPDQIMKTSCSSIGRPAGRFRHTRGKVVCTDSSIEHCREPPFPSCHRCICYTPWRSQSRRQYICSSPDSWVYNLASGGAPLLAGGSWLLICPLTFTLTRVGGVSSAEPRPQRKPCHVLLVSRP